MVFVMTNCGRLSEPWAIEVQAAATEKTRTAERNATAPPFSTSFIVRRFTEVPAFIRFLVGLRLPLINTARLAGPRFNRDPAKDPIF